MALPRIRFTIRRLMVLVMVVGVGTGLVVEGERRRARFRALADQHEDLALRCSVVYPGPDSEDQRRMVRLWQEWDVQTATYHARLAEKYGRAARFPWVPLAPDPPEPPPPDGHRSRRSER
jgi:hypothetical protein